MISIVKPGRKIILVNPWITDFAAYDFWLRPLGLLWIGAFLLEAGLEVKLIDCMDRTHRSVAELPLKKKRDGTGSFLKTEIPKPEVLKFVPRKFGRYGIPVEAFVKDLEAEVEPAAVLVTCSMTYWYPGAFEAIRIIREIFPETPVILGGRYATLCEEHARRFSGADEVMPGRPGRELASFIREKTGVEIAVPESFAEWPAPAHRLHNNTGAAAVMTAAGCPFRCSYCVSGLLYGKYETRTAESVADEIIGLSGEGCAQHIAFYDDALLVKWDEVLGPALDRVAERCGKLNFYTPNALHARLLDREKAVRMKAAGFSQIRIGYESAEDVFHRRTGGKVTGRQFDRAVENLAAAGFPGGETGAYIIFGHPDQTAEQVRRAVRRAGYLGVVPVPAEYSPIPGSMDFGAAVRTFKRSPALDPLLQNSSIIYYQHGKIATGEFDALKRECIEIRKRIV